MKISIIVPVYNVEGFLRRCLNSCIHQDLDSSEYEIIAVNDGSSDHSVDILKEYASNYKNISIIDKTNGGLSSARNAGLKVAKGEYVWFVDSDDWIKENVLLEIYKRISESDAEVLTYEAVTSNESGKVQSCERRSLIENHVYTGLEMYNSGYVFPYSGAPFYIFKRLFLEKNLLSFYEGILFEDLLFSCRMMACARRCIFVQDNYYYYYVREGSITQSRPSLKKALDAIKIADVLHEEQLEKMELADNYIYNSNIAASILGIQMQWCRLSGFDRNATRLAFVERDYWLDCIRKSRKFKFILPFMLLKLNIPLKIK